MYTLFLYFICSRQKSGIPRIQYGHAAVNTTGISFRDLITYNILVRPFKFGMWVYMGNTKNTIVFMTLTFNFKVTGDLLKVRFCPFFHILAQFSNTES